jgi:hypothetical protein
MTTPDIFTVSRRSTQEERQIALYQIYQQVLERQPLAYERMQLAKAEKDFLTDKIGVRRFLKELGPSSLYLNSFYYSVPNMRFLEQCFKHFLGRSPFDRAEIQIYCDILLRQGVTAMITALLDTEEYRKVFGCFTVPYPRQQLGQASPKAYLESQLLNHELNGGRSRSIPLIYWYQLGRSCKGGICRHPEADAVVESNLPETAIAELLRLLDAQDIDDRFSMQQLQHATF